MNTAPENMSTLGEGTSVQVRIQAPGWGPRSTSCPESRPKILGHFWAKLLATPQKCPYFLIPPTMAVFLYFFALVAEEGFPISSCSSLELYIQMLISFLFSFAFCFSSFHSYL